jgi:hypothetical protein
VEERGCCAWLFCLAAFLMHLSRWIRFEWNWRANRAGLLLSLLSCDREKDEDSRALFSLFAIFSQQFKFRVSWVAVFIPKHNKGACRTNTLQRRQRRRRLIRSFILCSSYAGVISSMWVCCWVLERLSFTSHRLGRPFHRHQGQL